MKMNLLQCPECKHEVAFDAAACPNCGHPFLPTATPPIVERKVFISQPTVERSFPTWAFFPIGIMAVILLVLGYVLIQRSSDTADANLSVNVNSSKRVAVEPVRETRPVIASTNPQPVSVPSQTTVVPGTSTVPPVAPATKGAVKIKATIVPSSGSSRAASGARFYLLDKDVETVLSDAGITSLEGNTLAGSLGLALVYPDRYADFQRAAMRALASHTKKVGMTTIGGEANFSGVDPNNYYLFGVARVGRGFALWNQPVSVVVGDNLMTLAPQPVTEIAVPSNDGEE